MNRITIPDAYRDYSLGSTSKLKLTSQTYVSHVWHGINGQVRNTTNISNNVPNTYGCKLFLIPTVRSGFTYTDCLDVEFQNVGTVNGRRLNATLHVNSVTFGPASYDSVGETSYTSSYTGIFMLPSYGDMELFFGRSDQKEFFPGFEQRYDAVKDLTITIMVRYADTNEIVDFGFNQYVTDIDCNNRWNSYGATEGVTFGSGYTNNLYTYTDCRLQISGSHISVPNDGRDHNYSDFRTPIGSADGSGEIYSEDPRAMLASNYMNACWATTSSGQFTVTFHGGNFSMYGTWYSPMLRRENPRKAATIHVDDMSKVDWNIRYDMPKRFSDVFDTLSSFGFIDTIPAEHQYLGYDLYLDGVNIKNQSTATYDAATRMLRVELKEAYLGTNTPYGKELRLCVHCSWVSGTHRATNTPVVHLNQMLFDGNPSTITNPSDVTVGLTKQVVNPKPSYGPGDIVEYFIAIDFEDYEPVDFDYEMGGANTYTRGFLSKFSFEDVIPNGLEIVGTPKVQNFGEYGGAHVGEWQGLLFMRDSPITLDYLQRYQIEEDYLESVYVREQDVYDKRRPPVPGQSYPFMFHQPYVSVPALAVRNEAGVYDNFERLIPLMKANAYGQVLTLSDLFAKNLCHNTVMEDETKYGTFVPGITWPEYGYNVSVTSNRISVTSKNDSLRQWGKVGSTTGIGREAGLGLVGIYYQCRVKDGVFNTYLTNTTKVSGQDVAVTFGGKKWISYASGGGTETYTSYSIPIRIPVQAQADATIYVGGYTITTEVVNGTISEDVTDIPGGSNVSVSYSPKAGYYLSSVTVDGMVVNASQFSKLYNFQNVRASHHIKVVYEKGYNIYTEVEHGQIDPDVLGVKAGGSAVVRYVPEDGYMLSTVTVDGTPQVISNCMDAYSFVNVQADHHIKVVFIPKYKIETEVVNGTITPTVTGIAPGESRTITYTPKDNNYYLKSVTVDDTALGASALKQHMSSYVFSNINEDHKIKVVYAKVPVITIAKQVSGELVWKKGSPEFQYQITGTDYLGDRHTYHRSMAFAYGDILTQMVLLKIPAGQWTVTELSENDWSLTRVQAGDHCTVSGKTGVLDTRDSDTARVTFVNQLVDWTDYTENDTEVNRLK